MSDFSVKRIAGKPGETGTFQLVDDDGYVWRVPIVESRASGKLCAAQNEYVNMEFDVEPSMEMIGDMNDACREHLEKELKPEAAETSPEIDASLDEECQKREATHADVEEIRTLCREHDSWEFQRIALLINWIDQLTELLRSARAIAERKGENTAWKRFSKSIQAKRIGVVTARVYKLQPGDLEGDEAAEDTVTWRSIEDDPPPLGQSVLVLSKDLRAAVAHRTDHNSGGYVSWVLHGTRPVWWMPIPDAPDQADTPPPPDLKHIPQTIGRKP